MAGETLNPWPYGNVCLRVTYRPCVSPGRAAGRLPLGVMEVKDLAAELPSLALTFAYWETLRYYPDPLTYCLTYRNLLDYFLICSHIYLLIFMIISDRWIDTWIDRWTDRLGDSLTDTLGEKRDRQTERGRTRVIGELDR